MLTYNVFLVVVLFHRPRRSGMFSAYHFLNYGYWRRFAACRFNWTARQVVAPKSGSRRRFLVTALIGLNTFLIGWLKKAADPTMCNFFQIVQVKCGQDVSVFSSASHTTPRHFYEHCVNLAVVNRPFPVHPVIAVHLWQSLR